MNYIQANGVARNAKKIKNQILKYFKMTRQPRRRSQCRWSQRLPGKQVKR